MSLDSKYMIPKFYYYITPLFILLDYFGGLSVRAAVLDSMPLYKNLYYGFCICCGIGIYFRPGFSAVVALFESMIIVLMTVLSVFLPYVRYIMEADVLNTNLDFTNTFSIPRIVNIVLSGTIGIFAFHGSLRMLGTPEDRPHSNTAGI
ncbi:MAG TPA: hypothetical protein DIU00_07450 [Phycisphaerales bacterium]|nr:hypothetical protein [Phycisphaerales bacterium]